MIRTAVAGDINELVSMARRLHAESRYAEIGLSFDASSMARTFQGLIDNDAGVVLIAPGVAFASGIVLPLYCNNALVTGQELNLWVGPEHRAGFGRELVCALEAAFKEKGACVFLMSAAETIRPEAMAAFYERLGYTPMDHTFVRIT